MSQIPHELPQPAQTQPRCVVSMYRPQMPQIAARFLTAMRDAQPVEKHVDRPLVGVGHRGNRDLVFLDR